MRINFSATDPALRMRLYVLRLRDYIEPIEHDRLGWKIGPINPTNSLGRGSGFLEQSIFHKGDFIEVEIGFMIKNMIKPLNFIP